MSSKQTIFTAMAVGVTAYIFTTSIQCAYKVGVSKGLLMAKDAITTTVLESVVGKKDETDQEDAE